MGTLRVLLQGGAYPDTGQIVRSGAGRELFLIGSSPAMQWRLGGFVYQSDH